MNMYHISYHTRDEAEDLSGFVAAETPAQAAALWFDWYRRFGFDDEADADRACTVNEIPEPTQPHAYDWAEIACVGWYRLADLARSTVA